jgi:hypothetical protein
VSGFRLFLTALALLVMGVLAYVNTAGQTVRHVCRPADATAVPAHLELETFGAWVARWTGSEAALLIERRGHETVYFPRLVRTGKQFQIRQSSGDAIVGSFSPQSGLLLVDTQATGSIRHNCSARDE